MGKGAKYTAAAVLLLLLLQLVVVCQVGAMRPEPQKDRNKLYYCTKTNTWGRWHPTLPVPKQTSSPRPTGLAHAIWKYLSIAISNLIPCALDTLFEFSTKQLPPEDGLTKYSIIVKPRSHFSSHVSSRQKIVETTSNGAGTSRLAKGWQTRDDVRREWTVFETGDGWLRDPPHEFVEVGADIAEWLATTLDLKVHELNALISNLPKKHDCAEDAAFPLLLKALDLFLQDNGPYQEYELKVRSQEYLSQLHSFQDAYKERCAWLKKQS